MRNGGVAHGARFRMNILRIIDDPVHELFKPSAIRNGKSAVSMGQQHVSVSRELAQPMDGFYGGFFTQIMNADGVVLQTLIDLKHILGVFRQLPLALLGRIVFHILFAQKLAPHQFGRQLKFQLERRHSVGNFAVERGNHSFSWRHHSHLHAEV